MSSGQIIYLGGLIMGMINYALIVHVIVPCVRDIREIRRGG